MTNQHTYHSGMTEAELGKAMLKMAKTEMKRHNMHPGRPPSMSSNAERGEALREKIMGALKNGPSTSFHLADLHGVTVYAVKSQLKPMIASGAVLSDGRRGARPTHYSLAGDV